MDAARYSQLQGQLGGPSTADFIATSDHNAALTAIAGVLNLQTGSHRSVRPPDEQVIDACGALGWIVSDVTTFLVDAQQTDLAAGQADGVTATTQLATS